MRTLFRAKRKIKWIMAMLVIGMLSGKAEAAELNTTEVVEAGDESGYEFPGLSIRIGEMKDGLFVRDYYEEAGIIFKELAGEERKTAFGIRDEVRKLSSLTPEMESAGYIIDTNTGLALSPVDYENMYGGDAGENAKTPAPVDENTRFGFVTFAAASKMLFTSLALWVLKMKMVVIRKLIFMRQMDSQLYSSFLWEHIPLPKAVSQQTLPANIL